MSNGVLPENEENEEKERNDNERMKKKT